MDNVTLARATMGTSLGFHIVFASLGVGLPLLLAIAEGLGLWRRDAIWMGLARRWAQSFGILFAVGAVSGTVLSFELGLLWPRFMAFSGSMIGLPFSAEAFAFFLEAIFLGLYLYGWDRLRPFHHWLCSLPLVVSGAASSLFVVMANGWMNTPAGFQLKGGQLVHVDPLVAALNPSVATEDPHMLFAAYAVSGFLLASVYAAGMLQGRIDTAHRRGIVLGMALGTVAILLAGIWGDASARFVYAAQPAKFAAMEGLFHTKSGAPLTIGGIPDSGQGKVQFGIQIPYGLSLLAALDPQAQVQGLDSVPPNDRPNPVLVHLSFDSMVGLSLAVGLVAIAFWLFAWRRWSAIPHYRLLLGCVVATGPAMIAALESGWFVTEFGRQPWVVQGILRTQNAATTAPALGSTFAIFLLIYFLLALTTAQLLLLLARRNRREPTRP
jgi:cytochrome d ubiquinol oxidase subunit I